MSKLRERMIRDLELKGYSEKTKAAYIRYVCNYARYFGKSPDNLGPDAIKEYLYHLITEKKVSRSYINIVYSALKFFYETTLQQEWDMKKIPRTKKEKRLPVVLSPAEIQRIFNTVKNFKHKAILMTIYASGLRVSEAANLKVSDIDSNNMQILIRQGKGKKDRYSLLSNANLQMLKEYYRVYRPTHWLFPGVPEQKPVSPRAIQKVFENAIKKAGINKEATVHSLRHSFATHLLESGVDIYYIQHLLGHTNVKTTSIYIHLQRHDVLKIVSPLDKLMGIQ